MQRVFKVALGSAATAGAIVLAERVAARRLRQRTDPQLDLLYRLPDGLKEHRIDTADGASLHAIERGEGRPLVLLHGVTLAASIWAPQLNELAGSADRPGFRVIAVDLRGHAESTVGSSGWGLSVLAQDLATVLKELDLRDAIVVGHSMGGMTLMQFCADQRECLAERVSGLCFVATAAVAPFHPMVLERIKLIGARAIDRLDNGKSVPQLRFSGNDLSLLACRIAFGKSPTAAAVEQVRACIESMDPESSSRSVIGIFDHDASEALRSVELPAEVIVGSRDLLTPASLGRAIAEVLPNGDFTVLRGCGHQVMQERPAELEDILRRLDQRVDALDQSQGAKV